MKSYNRRLSRAKYYTPNKKIFKKTDSYTITPSSQCTFEVVTELDRSDVVVYLATYSVGDGTRFFADNNRDNIELLGDADG